MITRDKNTYDILGQALKGQPYQLFIDDMFATKYNNPQFASLFPWGIPQIDFGYEQMEATVGLHAMASVVDYDSPAPLRGTQGATLSTGTIPRMKHGFVINEKEIRTQMLLIQRGAQLNLPALQKILFNSTDQLINGNHLRLTHMALQAESTGGYVLDSASNPDGISLVFDFNVPAGNYKKCGFGTYGTKYAWTNDLANPIGDLQDMVQFAEDNFKAYGVIRMSKATWRKFIAQKLVRERVFLNQGYINISDMPTGYQPVESQVRLLLADLGLPPIEVVDAICATEKYDKTTKSLVWTQTRPFADDVVVLRPAGAIGETKCAEPIIINDPAARQATFDGGRTLLIQTFDADMKTQKIQSELTALPVLSMPKQMIYLDVTQTA